jgi:hypothetical protein
MELLTSVDEGRNLAGARLKQIVLFPKEIFHFAITFLKNE